VHVASATGSKKLRTRNASRRVARAGRYRRAGVMVGPFVYKAQIRCPGKKAAIPPASSGGEYEFVATVVHGLHVCMEKQLMNENLR